MSMFKNRVAAVKAAKDALGAEAIDGTDFNVHETAEGWTFSTTNGDRVIAGLKEVVDIVEGKAEPAMVYVPAMPLDGGKPEMLDKTKAESLGMKPFKDIGSNEVWADPEHPLLVGGVIYPNKTRAGEARKAKERRETKPDADTPELTQEQLATATVYDGGKVIRKGAAVKPKPTRTPVPKPPTTASSLPTKQDTLLAMMRRKEGASSAEMEKAVGWQSHSVRGLLGTMRVKRPDLVITATKAGKGEPTRYHVADAPAPKAKGKAAAQEEVVV